MAHHDDISRKSKKRALGAAISAIAAGVPVASAQEAEPEENQNSGDELRIEEILVTATKRGELSMQDVPMAITAFGTEDIKLQGLGLVRAKPKILTLEEIARERRAISGNTKRNQRRLS